MIPLPDSYTETDVMRIARDLCPGVVGAIKRVPGGGNNLLYCVEADNHHFALKLYLSPSNDKRDRLGQEFTAYCFLHMNSITEIPYPIASDPARHAALYSWVDGVAAGVPGNNDIDRAIAFLSKLHTLRLVEGARDLPHAAEASLSAEALTKQITSRRERLAGPSQTSPALASFLGATFDPACARVLQNARLAYQQRGWSWEAEIIPVKTTLSPSDFGFHNALRIPGDDLVFLDFEYFGWDDPVRVVADFLLHPGHNPSQTARNRFFTSMTEIYAATDPDFMDRLHILYPIIALRWAMITLGDFLPHRMARRRQLESATDTEQILDRQMSKAQMYLASLNNEDGAWPYGD